VAHIAQSVEHFLGKEEVTGSNPVVGSSRRQQGRQGVGTEYETREFLKISTIVGRQIVRSWERSGG
jgi:hypothetical protein